MMRKEGKDLKILLLCDAPMCINTGGINQTLYNIFYFCKPENILCIAPNRNIRFNPPSAPYKHCYIGYDFELLQKPRNRLSKFLGKSIDWINYKYLNIHNFTKIKNKIALFKPDFMVSCPNGPIDVYMHFKLLPIITCTILPYFMDDWMYQSKLKWQGLNLSSWIEKLLEQNKNWLMISEELSELLQVRYKIKPERLLFIRNPVKIDNIPPIRPLLNNGKLIMAYAGALWPMHFDALLDVAKAIQILNNMGQLSMELVIYTATHHWNSHKNELEAFSVNYGGNIPYNNIHQKLSEADILLVAASFHEEYYTHSKGSLQTKITDYLKARRIVLSVGPNYTANHTFIKKYNCGITIQDDDPYLIAAQLSEITKHFVNYDYMIQNGWKVLQENFTFEITHKKLMTFLLAS